VIYKFEKDLYIGLLTYQYAYLQHGIIVADMSEELRKEKQNFTYFTAAGVKESEYLQKGPFNLMNSEVLNTGFARYDLLRSDQKQNEIVLMPTWRKGLLKDEFDRGTRLYDPNFVNSEYFKFYNGLINDAALIDLLEKNNYKLTYIAHPAFRRQIKDFVVCSDRISIVSDPNFTEFINKTKLFITDYSSVHFDFAYTGSSIIYSRFDDETFAEAHGHRKGYFEYEKDGFGPVRNTKAEIISEIEKSIKRNGLQEEKYAKRVEETFLFRDANNCKRIAEEFI
jgi:CDP-glycerol glycerophosphotransferase (TagB/SpsB family)